MEIETRIKGLVDILNSIDYIETRSSCEGHYKKGGANANVIFTLKDDSKKAELNKLMKTILSETRNHWIEADIRFQKEYYMIPGHEEIIKQYVLRITPFVTQDSVERRKSTDDSIKIVTDLIKKYLAEKY